MKCNIFGGPLTSCTTVTVHSLSSFFIHLKYFLQIYDCWSCLCAELDVTDINTLNSISKKDLSHLKAGNPPHTHKCCVILIESNGGFSVLAWDGIHVAVNVFGCSQCQQDPATNSFATLTVQTWLSINKYLLKQSHLLVNFCSFLMDLTGKLLNVPDKWLEIWLT